MNIVKLSWKNIISSPLNTALSLLLMTLGVGIISLIFLLNNQIKQQLQSNLKGIDAVVGSKGSPLQLILSSVYHIDNPTGNIPYKEAVKIENNPLVEQTIPLSFGDSYNGVRIVGTTRQYLDLYEAELSKGRLWEKSLEVTVGSGVAKAHKIKIGDTLYGTHGLVEGGHVHDDYPYSVVGILKPTLSVIDQLILTNTESVWLVHNHQKVTHEEISNKNNNKRSSEKLSTLNLSEDVMITSLLVKFKSPIGIIQVPRKINETTNLQAAMPALEISRLTKLLGFGVQTINTIALIIIIVSGLSIFISLYNSLKKRRFDLALMRVHGATRLQLIQLVIQEGLILSLIGTIFGLIISRTIIFVLTLVLSENALGPFEYELLVQELWLLPLAVFIGLLASIIPTISTYNINIPKLLSNE
tara:strand:+ start:2637 stop:3878 length:1242 start_codon:yes stop_codon:yes gene_type:complete